MIDVLLHSQPLQALIAVLAVAVILDFAFGVLAALASGVFDWAYVAEFLQTHLLGRVFPILLAAVGGTALGAVGDTSAAAASIALLGVAGLGSAAYLAETTSSIVAHIHETSARSKAPPA